MVWSPRGSMKNAPVVSPAHEKGKLAGSTCPASWSPELKMYWSGVPLGQNTPPTTGELCGSTHSSPILLMPQRKLLKFMTPNVSWNKFVQMLMLGRLELDLTSTGSAIDIMSL